MPRTEVRINAWCGPRNISTALMYSFAQRSDTRVFDEPLYGHYLHSSPADQYHPGAKEVLDKMELNGGKVVEMLKGEHGKKIVFYKQMTHHLLDLNRDFISSMKNIILTRDPEDMLPSFAKEIENPSLADVGYGAHLDLVEYLKSQGQTPIVLDSKKVLNNPKAQLEKLCEALEIPFESSMLKWKAGPRPEDGCWAKYWYKSVHKSTGFIEHKPKDEKFPEHLKTLLSECEPLYEKLSKLAL